ncbi:MAG: DNA polymerase IV [Chloroflexota bacterium]|nr:DNA polymerase IV [Chloroflexota bacterium]
MAPPFERSIAHLDLDAFYATVEEVVNPALKGQPIMVVMGEDLISRGVVATASYAARRLGVHSAMAVSQARKLCPEGVYLPVRHALYEDFSHEVMTLLAAEMVQLEQVSIDEAYLDLSDRADPTKLMVELQDRIVQKLGLSASVGLATNKLTAKMASGYKKPAGLTVVLPGEEAAFLAPLAVGKLHGVGPKSVQRLEQHGITTIGELAEAELSLLQELFGPRLGIELHQRASGEDDRPIVTERAAKSFSYEQTYFEPLSDRREFWRQIREMSAGLEARLKSRGLLARTVSIKLRFNDWRTITRAQTLLVPTDQAVTIAESAGELMRQTWKRGTPLRLLGVRVSNFCEPDAPRQLLLPNHSLPENKN